MQAWPLLALSAFVGLLIPAQAAMNVKIRQFAGNEFSGTAINFWVGTAALALIVAASFAGVGAKFDFANLARAPWWAWLGGFVGIGFVTCTVLIMPVTGNGAFTVAVVFGQLLGAVLLDHYGWLGNPHRPADPQRWLGVAVMLAGVLLVVPWKARAPAVPAAESAEHAVERTP